MFILAEMKNVTRIPPDLFNLKLNDAIAGELNKKLANKVNKYSVRFCYSLFYEACVVGGFKCRSVHSPV